MARRAVGMFLVAALAACGGGGDDGEDDTVALEDIEPIVDIDPCDLIDDDTASQLSGAEVGAAESSTEEDGTTSCEFAFADEDDADTAGSAIAASLRIGPGDEDDIPGGALARSLSIGDAAAVEEEEQKVRVVYIVREVVVRVEVAPGSGEVTPELVDEVIEFTETTEAPITEAVTGQPFEETTTTVDTETSTTADQTVEDLWRRTASEFRDQVGAHFEFECPGRDVDVASLATIWGTGTYTDDSAVCVAAVHDGRIALDEGGTVTIEMRPGQDAYPASTANGITSHEWPEWPGSFAVIEP